MQRPNYIDYAKVITMFLVIYGHYVPFMGLEMNDSTLGQSVHVINLFHMPLFFFVSGMLFKQIPYKESLKKIWSSLLVPYILLGMITIAIGLTTKAFIYGITFKDLAKNLIAIITAGDLIGGLKYCGPLWFCYALILIKLLQSIDNKVVKFAYGVLGVLVLYKGNVLPCRIDSALVGNLFFTMGYYSKTLCNKVFSRPCLWFVPLCIVGIGLLIATLSLSDDLCNRQVLSINVCYFGRYPILFLFGGIGGIMVILSLSSLLSSIKSNVVLELSNGMIVTLGFQQLLFMLFAIIIVPSYSFAYAISICIAVYFLCYLLTILSAKYCPALLGNRKLK